MKPEKANEHAPSSSDTAGTEAAGQTVAGSPALASGGPLSLTVAQRRRVQRIFEEQGWLVIASAAMPEYEPGAILPFVSYGDGNRNKIPGPMRVIGSATREEWLAQRRRYAGDPDYVLLRSFAGFFKVVAE